MWQQVLTGWLSDYCTWPYEPEDASWWDVWPIVVLAGVAMVSLWILFRILQ
jgi:hypothetical protein